MERTRKVLGVLAVLACMSAPSAFGSVDDKLDAIHSDVIDVKTAIERVETTQFELYGRINAAEARATGQASATAVVITALLMLTGRCLGVIGRKRC
jgi:hypothetical protein